MIRVLHVASFSGNIGDNANHDGFRGWFEELAGTRIAWTEFEIRDVYRGQRSFDLAFAQLANDHDLVVVGGGNYFELWVENSPTGTSFSITSEALAQLRVPVFFNALGVDAGQGAPAVSLGRFRSFLGNVLASDRYLVSVRNDGSLSTVQTNMPDLPLDRVIRLPDGGFFADYRLERSPVDGRGGPVIGINLAGDMLEARFPGGALNSYDAFLRNFVAFLVETRRIYPDARLIFFPHIFRDLKVYADILAILPDTIRRQKCRVAPYDSGSGAALEIFSAYRSCDVVVGMRFHANVVAIGSDVPAIGLVCYDQIRLLYEELGQTALTVDVQEPDFEKALLALTCSAIDHPEAAHSVTKGMMTRVQEMRRSGGDRIRQWLQRNGLAR